MPPPCRQHRQWGRRQQEAVEQVGVGQEPLGDQAGLELLDVDARPVPTPVEFDQCEQRVGGRPPAGRADEAAQYQ